MSNKRVLIIDDEAEIRRNLSFGLTQEGFVCTSCPDGISAIHELYRARQKGVGYNYLITDIFMPDIDGLKILKVIKKENPDLPVLVITGFGDDALKTTALSETNTGYLDKPFDIKKLVRALEDLKPGASTLDAKAEVDKDELRTREVVSAYLTIRITKPEKSEEIFNKLYFMDGISSCEATRGYVDIILLGQASSVDDMQKIFNKVKMIDGIELLSTAPIERPKLDKDVDKFIKEYQSIMKRNKSEVSKQKSSIKSYLFIDIDPQQIQQIFTTVFCIDEVIFCDVIENGTKLVGMVYDSGTQNIATVMEKMKQVDGVLRVRKAEIIKMMDM